MPSGSPAIEPALRRCPAAADAASFREFALPGSARLWGLTCRKGSVATLHWFQAEGSVGEPSPLLLPDADRGHLNAGDQGFAESVFDFDSASCVPAPVLPVARIAASSAHGLDRPDMGLAGAPGDAGLYRPGAV